MGPSPTYHPPEAEECETLVEHGLPLWAEPAVGYCSRLPRPFPIWGSGFVGAREVPPWVAEQKPLGKSPLRSNPSPESTYLPTLQHCRSRSHLTRPLVWVWPVNRRKRPKFSANSLRSLPVNSGRFTTILEVAIALAS